MEFVNEKVIEEVKGMKDKLQKMALQFDKELSSRDKMIKGVQSQTQDEVFKAFNQLHSEFEIFQKIVLVDCQF